jgi:hypothetical protein
VVLDLVGHDSADFVYAKGALLRMVESRAGEIGNLLRCDPVSDRSFQRPETANEG